MPAATRDGVRRPPEMAAGEHSASVATALWWYGYFHSASRLLLPWRVQCMLCYRHPDVPGRLDEDNFPMQKRGEDLLMPVSAPGKDGHALRILERGDILPEFGCDACTMMLPAVSSCT
jgi:hypothetical protein